MNIKILVSYHKPAKLIKDDIWTPIKIGESLNWDVENLIQDDTGDNISSRNDVYNELTSIYWAWKNYRNLGNLDFIGFCHYRRIPIFSRRNERISAPIEIDFKDLRSLFKKVQYDKVRLTKLLSEYQCLAGGITHRKYSVREQYKKASLHGEHIYQDLLDVESIINDFFLNIKKLQKNISMEENNIFGISLFFAGICFLSIASLFLVLSIFFLLDVISQNELHG